MKKHSLDCPCGCGQRIPVRATNHFLEGKPYWEWICINPACKWRDQLWKNQTGDPACSMCGRRRMLSDHWAKSDGKSHRINANGVRVKSKSGLTLHWQGRGFLDDHLGDGDPGNGIEGLRQNPANGRGDS